MGLLELPHYSPPLWYIVIIVTGLIERYIDSLKFLAVGDFSLGNRIKYGGRGNK